VDVAAEPTASRWLWLVKWLLAIPHYVVLAFLWLAFGVLSVVAFFAILLTGRYPRAIFEFNVGVLRWSWRVAYYAYGALATDEYPPFTLEDVEDYPAHLDVDYPEHLSRGLVLVKWWLLAIPHYVVVAILVGSGGWAARETERWPVVFGGGLLGVLALVAAVVLAATGSYPRPLYDLLLGLNRWVLRVAGYVGLMTDEYPPFRLDQGPHEPDRLAVSTLPATPAPLGVEAGPTTGAAVPPRSGWTAGRTVGVVIASFATVLGLGLLAGGGALVVADNVARDGRYLTTVERTFTSAGYAVSTASVVLDAPPGASSVPAQLLGDVRLRVTPTNASVPVFIGIAPADRAEAYLAGVARTEPAARTADGRYIEGSAPATPPAEQTFWTDRAVGTGTQELTWTPETGRWSVVLMNADASAGVSAAVSAGATLPWIGTVGVALLVVGVLLLGCGIAFVARCVGLASRA
jgi:hypothetical protein